MRITVSGSYTLTEYDESDNLPPTSDTPPICPGCHKISLKKVGFQCGKQRYKCRDCQRTSYGKLPVQEWRPRCPFCGENRTRKRQKLPFNRQNYQCTKCWRTFTNVPLRPHKERGDAFPYLMAFSLHAPALTKLRNYTAATGLSQSAAIRAIFREVLNGTIFWTFCSARRVTDSWGRTIGSVSTSPKPSAVPRDPQAAAQKLPNLQREALLKGRAASTNHLPVRIVAAEATIAVRLDAAAKEGLLHAMTRTGLNHADAARLLIARAEPPPKMQNT